MTKECELLLFTDRTKDARAFVYVWQTEPHLTGRLTVGDVEYEIAGVRKEREHDRSRFGAGECNSD